MNTFTKKSSEQYPIVWEFKGLLPPGTTLSSGVASAIKVADNSDQTSAVLASPNAIIAGTQATVTVKGGVNGVIYKLTMLVSLAPAGTLSDDILMTVGD